MSFTLKVTVTGFDHVEAMLARLDPLDSGTLLEELARLIQRQTRRRIESERITPGGSASKATGSATLSRSIGYTIRGETVMVGSRLTDAGIHEGDAGIRPFLGVSAANAREIVETTADFIRRRLLA